jgi:integrase
MNSAAIPFPAPTPAIIADVIELYFSHLEMRVDADEYEQVSFEKSRVYLMSFLRLYGRQDLTQCHQYDLLHWLRSEPQWSPATRKGAQAAVLGCFNWAIEIEIIARNPYRRVRGLNLKVDPKPPMSKPDYVAVMREAARRRGSRSLRRALFFLRRTGCRVGEMRNVTWPDIDFDNGVARLTRHKTRRSTGRIRMIGLEPCVLRFLRNLKSQQERARQNMLPFMRDAELAGNIFLSAKRQPWKCKDSFSRLFRRWANRAGVAKETQAKCLRQSFTVDGVRAGLSDRAIADQLGHSSTRMVSWYAEQTRRESAHLRNVAAQALHKPRTPKTDPPK